MDWHVSSSCLPIMSWLLFSSSSFALLLFLFLPHLSSLFPPHPTPSPPPPPLVRLQHPLDFYVYCYCNNTPIHTTTSRIIINTSKWVKSLGWRCGRCFSEADNRESAKHCQNSEQSCFYRRVPYIGTLVPSQGPCATTQTPWFQCQVVSTCGALGGTHNVFLPVQKVV